MLITKNDVEVIRDIAKAFALLPNVWRNQHPLGQEAISRDEGLAFFRSQLAAINRLRQRLSTLDPDMKSEVLHLIRVTNSHEGHLPCCFAGYTFPSFHELALTCLEIMSEALPGFIQTIENRNLDSPKNWLDLCDITFRTRERESTDFQPDEVALAIEREASAALNYLVCQSEIPQPQPAKTLSSPDSSQAPASSERDPDLEQRDRWIYSQRCAGKSWERIREECATQPLKYRHFKSVGGIRRAAERYAKRHNLPLPEGKPGRPQTS